MRKRVVTRARRKGKQRPLGLGLLRHARAATLAEKPAFKNLLETRRCLVLADGFYEWRKEGKGKVPMRFKLKSGEPFAFAGLWDSWKQPDGNLLRTYTIVTTEPDDVLRAIQVCDAGTSCSGSSSRKEHNPVAERMIDQPHGHKHVEISCVGRLSDNAWAQLIFHLYIDLSVASQHPQDIKYITGVKTDRYWRAVIFGIDSVRPR